MGAPIIFTVTTAGKNAALDAQNRGVKISLKSLILGSGKGAATKSATDLKNKGLTFPLISGDIEPQSSTLRFSVTMSSDRAFDAYELGLYTDRGVLFAIASTTGSTPLVKLHPEVAIVVGSFGLHLGDVDANSVTVMTDPSSPIAVQMMENHLAANDPHPQYLKDSEFNTAAADIIRRLEALERKEIIPVGGVFITYKHYPDGQAVTRALGYGIWKRFGKGMTLVGHDPDVLVNGKVDLTAAWWRNIGNKYGEFNHKLTIEEMPNHKHRYMSDDSASSNGSATGRHIRTGHVEGADFSQHDSRGPAFEYFTPSIANETGGDKPHNNVQPSLVVAMWLRVANENGNSPQLYQNNDAGNLLAPVSANTGGSEPKNEPIGVADCVFKVSGYYRQYDMRFSNEDRVEMNGVTPQNSEVAMYLSHRQLGKPSSTGELEFTVHFNAFKYRLDDYNFSFRATNGAVIRGVIPADNPDNDEIKVFIKYTSTDTGSKHFGGSDGGDAEYTDYNFNTTVTISATPKK